MPPVNKLLTGKHVLLVEDETLIALDAQETLLDLGAAGLVHVRTVREGLEALEAKCFDVALLDLRLGHELSLPLALRLASLGTPFGILTGFGGDGIPVELKDRPYLSKPFTPQQLSIFLQHLLAGQAEPTA